jgi:hypothetical protein
MDEIFDLSVAESHFFTDLAGNCGEASIKLLSLGLRLAVRIIVQSKRKLQGFAKDSKTAVMRRKTIHHSAEVTVTLPKLTRL